MRGGRKRLPPTETGSYETAAGDSFLLGNTGGEKNPANFYINSSLKTV